MIADDEMPEGPGIKTGPLFGCAMVLVAILVCMEWAPYPAPVPTPVCWALRAVDGSVAYSVDPSCYRPIPRTVVTCEARTGHCTVTHG